MRKLDNSTMDDGRNPDLFFVQVNKLADKPKAIWEPITIDSHRKMDAISEGIAGDYDLVKFLAMKNSTF